MKAVRLEVTVPENVAFDVETEYNRLHNQLVELKRKGIVAKGFRLNEMDVKRLVFLLGIAELRKRGFEQLRESLNCGTPDKL